MAIDERVPLLPVVLPDRSGMRLWPSARQPSPRCSCSSDRGSSTSKTVCRVVLRGGAVAGSARLRPVEEFVEETHLPSPGRRDLTAPPGVAETDEELQATS